MIVPRLASHVLVAALRRRAESEGGFATVLAKGDEMSGAILLLLTDRSGARRILERVLGSDGSYIWRSAGDETLPSAAIAQNILDKRQRYDPDLWVVELEIASIDDFAADLAQIG